MCACIDIYDTDNLNITSKHLITTQSQALFQIVHYLKHAYAQHECFISDKARLYKSFI